MCKVYHDPLTRSHLEGEAFLLSRVSTIRSMLFFAVVRFPDDDTEAIRLRKVHYADIFSQEVPMKN